MPDGTKHNTDAKGGDQQKSTCCASATTIGRACCSAEEKASGCCSPGSNENGCCTAPSKIGQDPDLVRLAAELGTIDLNKWVGKYCQILKRKLYLSPISLFQVHTKSSRSSPKQAYEVHWSNIITSPRTGKSDMAEFHASN